MSHRLSTKSNTNSNLKHNGQEIFSRAKRIVIKVGSALLVDQNGYLSPRHVRRIVELVVNLRHAGKQVVLVSSGAVSASKILRIARPKQKVTLTDKQAYSSIGQVYLMEKYRRAFARFNFLVGQILISKFSINHRTSYLNARNTIHQLLHDDVIPIINENDPLATDEFRFGENDILGALISGLVDAELYVIFSKIDGVYQVNQSPHFTDKKKSSIYSIISNLSPEFMKNFKATTSDEGSGGIVAKLKAARLANQLGVPALIKNGNHAQLDKILQDDSGTLIVTKTHYNTNINARKRWLLSQVTPKGNIVVDDGAVTAIKKGKSLLPGGIITINGNITEGDICTIVDQKKQIIARGLCNYSTKELDLIKGQQSGRLESILGRISHSEVIHRNNLVLWDI